MQTRTEAAEFKSRRQQLIAQMVEGVAIIPTAAGGNPQPRQPLSLPIRQLFLLPLALEPEALLVFK